MSSGKVVQANAFVGRSAQSPPCDQWSVTLFAKNLFDAYAETSAAQTRAYIQTAADGNGDPVYVRSYRHDVLPPRMVGVRFTWEMAH